MEKFEFVVGTGVVIDAQRHLCWRCHRCTAAVVQVASSSCGSSRAGGVVDAWQHWMELCGADGSEYFNVRPGHAPLVVYYRVAVLFNKWYVSD